MYTRNQWHENIRRRCEDIQTPLWQLAATAGVSVSTLQRWLREGGENVERRNVIEQALSSLEYAKQKDPLDMILQAVREVLQQTSGAIDDSFTDKLINELKGAREAIY